MHTGQHHKAAIPFWCIFLLTCCIVVIAPACSDHSQKAAQEAALAQRALTSNDLPTAHAAITAAIADRDDVVEYHILRGRIELARGSSGAAFNAYSNALALDATNLEALLQVGQLGLTTGNLRESLDATQRALELDPNQLDALLLRGIHSMIKRNYAEAITYSDKILALSPGHEGGSILKARALYMLHKPQEALETLSKISGQAADSQAASLTRLEIYRAQRQPLGMLAEFGRLRRLRPNDPALRLDEANLRFKLGDRDQGEALIEDVLTGRETDQATANQAISLWREYGVQDVSASTFDRIGRNGSIAARRALVGFLIDQGRSPEAARALAQIPSAGAAGLKARFLVLSGADRQAAQLASVILTRDKTDCDALLAAAGSALKRRLPDEGLRYAEQASSECPSQEDAWMLAANAYSALGRDNGASRVYGQALDANKQSAQLTAAYTQWLLSRRKTREAVAIARRLTQYAPALLSGWRLYEDLCRKFDQSCVADAETGLATAQTLLGVDLAPGEPPPNGLLGRFVDQ